MLAGTCGPTQDIGGSVPSRNAVTMGSMPSAWILARGPYCPAKATSAKPPPTTVGTPPSVTSGRRRFPGTAQVAAGLFPRLAVPALAAGLRLRTRAELRVLIRRLELAVRVAVAVVLRALAGADGAREAGRVDGAVDAGCRLEEPTRPVCVCRRDESREDDREAGHLFKDG